MKSLILVIGGLWFLVGIAGATLPDPWTCSVGPCDEFGGMITYPDPVPGGAAEFTCIIRNFDYDPIPDAYVEIHLMVPSDHLICPEADLHGTTDAVGSITVNITAGGCTTGLDAVEIIANGMYIRHYQNLKSPDFDGASSGGVDLGDYIVFGGDFSAGAPGCHDYFNDGACELGDFIVFGEAWGHICSP